MIHDTPHGDVGKRVQKARHEKKRSHKLRGDAKHLRIEDHQKNTCKREHEIVSQIADEISDLVAYTERSIDPYFLIHAKKLLSVFEPYMSMISFLNVPETARIMRFFLLIFCGEISIIYCIRCKK